MIIICFYSISTKQSLYSFQPSNNLNPILLPINKYMKMNFSMINLIYMFFLNCMYGIY